MLALHWHPQPLLCTQSLFRDQDLGIGCAFCPRPLSEQSDQLWKSKSVLWEFSTSCSWKHLRKNSNKKCEMSNTDFYSMELLLPRRNQGKKVNSKLWRSTQEYSGLIQWSVFNSYAKLNTWITEFIYLYKMYDNA